MTLYLAFHDFYAVLIGVFATKRGAILAARDYDDGWVEERVLDSPDVVNIVWQKESD